MWLACSRAGKQELAGKIQLSFAPLFPATLAPVKLKPETTQTKASNSCSRPALDAPLKPILLSCFTSLDFLYGKSKLQLAFVSDCLLVSVERLKTQKVQLCYKCLKT
jgi:hypothetical protein